MLKLFAGIFVLAGLATIIPVISGCDQPETRTTVTKERTATVSGDGSVRDEGGRETKKHEQRGPTDNN